MIQFTFDCLLRNPLYFDGMLSVSAFLNCVITSSSDHFPQQQLTLNWLPPLRILTERKPVCNAHSFQSECALEIGSCLVFYPVQNLHFLTSPESLVF